MSCSNAACHCQSEVLITRQGSEYCSEHCAGVPHSPDAPCSCGHAGCSAPEEQGLTEGL